MNRSKPLALLVGAVIVDAVLLSGCSVSVQAPSPEATQAQPTASEPASASASASPATTSADPSPSTSGSSLPADALVPGYAPGEAPPVPLFSLPDISRVSTAGRKLRDKLKVEIKDIPGFKVTAVRCTKDGEYSNAEAGLALYGDGSGSYVGPDGSYTRGRDGPRPRSVTGSRSPATARAAAPM